MCEPVIALASNVHIIHSTVLNSVLWNNFHFKTNRVNSDTIIHTPTILVTFLNKLFQNRNMTKSAHYISFCQTSSIVFCTEIQNITNTLWWDIKTFKCTLVCWHLDTLYRSVIMLTTTILCISVNCVTLWFYYVGRPGETTEKRLLWLWAKAVIMLDWGSSTLDITGFGIDGILYCLYGFGYCAVLMLAVLTDGRWKLAATYCNTIRCHHCGVKL